MALKSSSPINLAALRQDYSALPRIAAVKAQADQQMIGAIQSGLQKRKERIEKKEKNDLNEKLLQDLIDSDPDNKIVPPGMTNKELAKIITLKESVAYRQAQVVANKAAAKEAQLIQAARNAADKLGLPPGVAEANPRGVLEAAMKVQIESLQGKEPKYELVKYTDADGNERTVRVNVAEGTFSNIIQQPTPSTPPQASSGPTQVRLPGGLTASRVDPKTGRPPVPLDPSEESLTSYPSLAERNAAEKARRDLMFQDVTDIYKAQARTGVVDRSGIAKALMDKYPNISESVVDGIIEQNLTKIRGESISRLQDMEKSLPGIIKYVLSLAQIDPSKGQAQGSGIGALFGLGKLTGKEYEAGVGDIEANPEFNAFLRTEPEILTILGVPQNTIADIMRLGSELPYELGTKTRYNVQELNSAARPFE